MENRRDSSSIYMRSTASASLSFPQSYNSLHRSFSPEDLKTIITSSVRSFLLENDGGLFLRSPLTDDFRLTNNQTIWNKSSKLKLSRNNSAKALLGVGNLKSSLKMRQRKLVEVINRLIGRHCHRVPLGGVFGQEGKRDLEHLGNEHGREEVDPQVASGRQRRVLILMSDTGGGHRASAEAIKATFELEYEDEYKVDIIDLWKDHTPWPFNQVPRTYSFMVRHETLWKLAFYGTSPRIVHQTHMAATATFIAREVAKGLLKYQPDLIVSVHPLMQHVPLRVLRARGLLNKIPFTTVVTDLSTCHPTWFHRLVNICFCPTKEVAQRALKAGLRPSQIKVHGLPIRPSFCRPTRPKVQLRRELEMHEELPAVLLMGGGEGMGPVEATAVALLETLYDSEMEKPRGQLVVICGRNKRLAEKLESLSWRFPVQIKGFVSNMSDWMGACDCVITKAGPGSIAESMIRGLPMVINDYIAGQEVGNVPFVVENGVGKYSQKPEQTAKIIAEWFGPKAAELKDMSQNALKLARPDAVIKIVHDLHELVKNLTPVGSYKFAYT